MPLENLRTADASLQIMLQPDASVPGSSIAYGTDNTYKPGNKFRSAEISSAGVAGNLEVHLVNDPADRWYIMELAPGVEKGRYFDSIRSTNTTAVLSTVTLFPCI